MKLLNEMFYGLLLAQGHISTSQIQHKLHEQAADKPAQSERDKGAPLHKAVGQPALCG